MRGKPKFFLQIAVRVFLLLITFLAPLKLGGVIGLAQGGFFPLNLLQWLFMSWPPFLLAPAAALAYWLALFAYPPPERVDKSWLAPGLWGAFALLSAFGLARTTEWDFALQFLPHLCGVACFAAAVHRVMEHEKSFRGQLLTAICVGALWSCVTGWQQHFGGLEETRRFALANAQKSGMALSSGLQGKLLQSRIFGPFANANVYAAHLVLVAPLTLLGLWRLGGRFEPVRISRPLLSGIGTLLFAGALFWSSSRGAAVGLVVGVSLGLLTLPSLRRWRWPLLGACALGALVVVFALSAGRDLASVASRVDYYQNAALMFVKRPLTGVGWGEFFPHYCKFKAVGAEVTRAPHNMLLGAFAQSGLFAGLAALGCLLLPAGIAFFDLLPQERERRYEWVAAVVGVSAWSIHALLDFNIQIPGTVATVAMLPLFCLAGRRKQETKEDGESPPSKWGKVLTGGFLLLSLASFSVVARVPGEILLQKFGDHKQLSNLSLATAERRCAKVAERLPNNTGCWLLLGQLAESRAALGTAEKAYQEVLARTPHRAGDWSRLSRTFLAQGKMEAAVKANDEAIAWYPTHPRYLLERSFLRCNGTLPAGDWALLLPLTVALSPGFAPGGRTAEIPEIILHWPEKISARKPQAEIAMLVASLNQTKPFLVEDSGRKRPLKFVSDEEWTNRE